MNPRYLISMKYHPEGEREKPGGYLSPEILEFSRWEELKRDPSMVESVPLIRSPYHAERHIRG